MPGTDVTDQVGIEGLPDEELLSVTRCICGKEFGVWEFYISIYPDDPYRCPSCGHSFYYTNHVSVYALTEREVEAENQRIREAVHQSVLSRGH